MGVSTTEEAPVLTEQPVEQVSAPARFRPWRLLVWVLVLGLLGVLGWKLVTDRQAQPQSGLAPDFTLKTFDGQEVRLSSLRGKVVVLNFWASWCKPCEEEADELEQAWRVYRDKGVVFIGVDYVDTESAALDYIKRFNITYPNGPDTGTRISQAYRIQGVPETFFINRKGEIVHLKIAPLTWDELTARLDAMLAEPGD
jgi:cytochrome c biogenesis protein CcmG/thiol:disulfide interchange protein DsbE